MSRSPETSPGKTTDYATAARLPAGPTGLGTSAARIALRRLAEPVRPGSPRRDTSFPDLYCPDPVRIDEGLGEEVDRRLVAWAEEVGIYAGRLEGFRDSGFGRLAMLVHPDSDDPDQLLLNARWLAALFAADDYYSDDERLGAVPVRLPPRLTLAVSAMDRPHLLGESATRLRDALRADPVLVAITSSLGHVASRATPSQMARIRHETIAMFVAWTAEAAWRHSGEVPAVWEFLASRQHNSFLPCMTLIDVVGGYALPADLYSDPRVRRAAGLAASATVIVNDLYSMAKEQASGAGDFNLPTLIAAEQHCSLREAVGISVRLHNEVVRAFESAHRDLALVPSPELQRFLLGLRAWMGGCREWHSGSVRYSS